MERNTKYNFDSSLVNKTKFQFKALLFFLCTLCLLNILYKVNFVHTIPVIRLNLWNPTWLMFGPAIYFITQLIRLKPIRSLSVVLHHIPFLAFLTYFSYIYLTIDLKDPWLSKDFIFYQNSFFIIPVSLASYSIIALKRFTTISEDTFPHTKSLILSLIGQYFLLSVVHSLTFVAWGIIHVNLMIEYRFFNYGILLLIFISIIYYFLKNYEKSKGVYETNASELDKTFILQATRMEKYFTNSKIYLNPNLNLDMISNDLSIPKHAISNIFKEHYKTNFHMYVAKLRIAYAIELMNDQPFLSIDFIATSSGFNSKPSFNKYFKLIMKITPSEYLQFQEETK